MQKNQEILLNTINFLADQLYLSRKKIDSD